MTTTRIIISGTVDLPPEKLDAALAAAKPLIEGALTEPGCLDYDWCPDPLHPGRLRVFERWESEAALAYHFENEWYLRMRDTLGSFGLLGASTAKYRVDLTEPVYDETMTPRADFFTDKAGGTSR
jgi:quinol monooxygenase YgiN